jgi:hypothetical protein
MSTLRSDSGSKKTIQAQCGRQIIPFQVHHSSTLYKACADALGVPPTHKDNKIAVGLTNHLVQMTLLWTLTNGAYNPSLPFKAQEKTVFQSILFCPFIPSMVKKPINLVREHLHVIHSGVDSTKRLFGGK